MSTTKRSAELKISIHLERYCDKTETGIPTNKKQSSKIKSMERFLKRVKIQL